MNWDYLAGFVDGEGTITFERYKIRSGKRYAFPLFIVCQKHPEILHEIREFLGIGKIKLVKCGDYENYRLQIRGRQILPILENLYPKLIVKKDQCRLLIKFIKHRNEQGHHAKFDQGCWDMVERMRFLNRRGNSGVHNSWPAKAEKEASR